MIGLELTKLQIESVFSNVILVIGEINKQVCAIMIKLYAPMTHMQISKKDYVL